MLNGQALAETLLSHAPQDSRFQTAPERDFFVKTVSLTWDILRREPAFYAKLQSYVDEEQLRQLKAIKADTETIKVQNQAILEEVAALKRALQPKADEFKIKEEMLLALARKSAEGNPSDFDAALRGLERALEVAHDQQLRGRLPSNISDAVDEVIARVDALNDAGDLDGGQAALDAAIEAQVAGTARLYDKGTAQTTLTRDVAGAARYALARFDLDAPDTPKVRFEALRSLWDEWYVRGRDKGLNFDLEVSIVLAEAPRDRATGPGQRGAAANDLAISLGTLGERESDTERLEQAVAAFRAALEEQTRERVPQDWAMTQNNLGNALARLGERDSGTEKLEQAVAAYRVALEERTRERVSLGWAETQNNLGNALQTLGQRESGTERFGQAVAAYRAALEERLRERVSLDYGTSCMSMATALSRIGERNRDPARFDEALELSDEAIAIVDGTAAHHYEMAKRNRANTAQRRDRLRAV